MSRSTPLGNDGSLKHWIRLLYEFYHQQNAWKPGSIHATYLVIGIQASDHRASAHVGVGQESVEDDNMRSSPIMSSSLPLEEDPDERPTFKVVALVREQDLEGEVCMQNIASILIPLFSAREANKWTI